MSATPPVTVLVDARHGGGALEATLGALGALASTVDVVVVGGPPGDGAVPVDDAAPGEGFEAALGRVVHARVAVVTAGVTPTDEWLASMTVALDRAHVSAVAGLVTDPATGAPRPRPAALSFVGHPVVPWPEQPPAGVEPTMLLGDAWMAWREDVVAVGGFDPDLGRSHLLIDLAWRLWLRAGGVVVDPAVAVPGDPLDPEPTPAAAVAAERDALVTIYRHLDDADLGAALPAALVLSRRRLASRAGGAVADDAGVDAFLERLDDLRAQRQEGQARRRRSDAELMAALRDPLRPDDDDERFLTQHRSLVAALAGGHRFGGRFRIVVATRDSLAPRMAGPGIRAWNLARELAREHDVRLVSLSNAELSDPAMSIEVADESGVPDLLEWCDVFVFQGWVMAGQACLDRQDRVVVVDIYDPLHLEQLEQARDGGEAERHRAVRDATEVLNAQLRRGDFFFCASDRQRDLWLGSLASLGRVNAVAYDDDPSLRRLLDVVPFGVPDLPPVATRRAIKGVLDGVGPDDEVILWGGGVYNWFDPLTLIRAVDGLRRRRPQVRLVFLGMRHPNPEVPEMAMAVAARRLATELGIAGTHVIFNEEWVAYDDRQNYLLDADVAVTTHLHHVETEFAFRTRVLDYLWAGLPTVATTGDALADLIEREGLGITVPPSDVDALEQALERLLDDEDLHAACVARIAEVRPRLAWPEVLRPVIEFCRAPRRAPDLVAEVGGLVRLDPVVPPAWKRYLAVAVAHLRAGELGLMVRRGVHAVRRRLARPGASRPAG